jgi:uncharacterized protein (DUF849 family)
MQCKTINQSIHLILLASSALGHLLGARINLLLARRVTTFHLSCLALGGSSRAVLFEDTVLVTVGHLVAGGAGVELPRVANGGKEALFLEHIYASCLGEREEVAQFVVSLFECAEHGLLALLARLGIEDLLRPATRMNVHHGVLWLC